MNVDALADERDIVFFADALPEDGLHHVAIAFGGSGGRIPIALMAPGIQETPGV